jgi:hypothetical protein
VLTPPLIIVVGALARLLLKSAEHRDAGLRNGRVGWIARLASSPSRPFDERALLPGTNLLEFQQIC